MLEQRQHLESIYMNDTVEEQNRILRQMNDFILVLSKALCGHIGTQVSSLLFLTKINIYNTSNLILVPYRTID